MSRPGPVTINHLQEMKQKGEKIAMLTCYDATFARSMDEAGVDIILVGDSLGRVSQGRDTTVAVTTGDVAYHTTAVAAGAGRAFLIGDMPFGSFHSSEVAMENAGRLMAAGAHMIKIEGAGPYVEVVEYLSSRGIAVCGHLGLTPQSVHKLGGFRVQGRADEDAIALKEDAQALQDAGAQLLVLEAIPSRLAAEISGAIDIPTIGIGAGPDCDGQVLVMHDMLGLFPRPPKFVRNFMEGAGDIRGAFEAYVQAVRSNEFPAAEHQY